MKSTLFDVLHRIIYHVRLGIYWFCLPLRVNRIRKKKKIKVLFIISELSCWKSELLYLNMLNHQRFNPLLGVSSMQKKPQEKEMLINYLLSKQYVFFDLDEQSSSIDVINPDIIFYYKPYKSCYSPGQFFDNNKKYVFCGLDYCFEATTHEVHIEKELFDYCWQFYIEHSDIANRRRDILGYRARNNRVTGVPMQDILLLPKSSFTDPWKDNTGRKRIIYAPHHSIKGTNGDGIEFATFLDFGEPMLTFAKKYCDEITIAFKPHPNLYLKLIKIWGQEKTDNYYNEWMRLPNTQLETGEYVGLFKYSDAIIHDCASFIVEYLYVDNPSLYLISDSNNMEDMFDFVKKGYECYEHGKSEQEIEKFIISIIGGHDSMREIRQNYINSQLLPPNGKTACDNIIASILE